MSTIAECNWFSVFAIVAVAKRNYCAGKNTDMEFMDDLFEFRNYLLLIQVKLICLGEGKNEK